jgi:hypothetical protein
MASDNRPPYDRRPTRPIPREELAPVAATDVDDPPETRPARAEAKALAKLAEDDVVTLTRCPLCAGQGMVLPEIAVTLDKLITQAKEEA